jgi:hypothetical protein
MESSFHIWVFLISTFIGYFHDILGVKGKFWNYPTKSGYSSWIGLYWGALILSIVKIGTIPIQISGILGFIILLFEYFYGSPKIFSNPILFVRYFSVFFLIFSYPNLFLLSFFFGALFELIAIKKFHTWKYNQDYSFILFGFGYAMILILTVIISEFLISNRIPSFIEIIVCLMIFATFLIQFIFNKKK